MPEIDPQSERQITESLRRLAAFSQRQAPAEIGDGLMTSFRRHHVRRRRIRRAGMGAVAICIALIAAAISLRTSPKNEPIARKMPEAVTNPVPVKPVQTVAATNATTTRPKSAARHRQPGTAVNASIRRPFLALPGYDPTVPKDQLHVVRVQMPASELWQIGAPISASMGTRSMTADFVVSQSGTPYAVRLVQ